MAIGLPNIHLDKCAGQLLRFPRRGHFARAQTHDHVLHPNGLTGLQRDVADDAVALVKNTKNGDPFRHGRDAFGGSNCLWHVDSNGFIAANLIIAA